MIMRLMEHFGARSIPFPEELARAAAFTAAKLMQSPNERNNARGAELAHKISVHNLKLYAEAQKLARQQESPPAASQAPSPQEINLREAARRDPAILRALIELREQNERLHPPPPGGGPPPSA